MISKIAIITLTMAAIAMLVPASIVMMAVANKTSVSAFSLQSAFGEEPLGVVIILYPPTSCENDFDKAFWSKYDSAMTEEWGISSQTLCLEGLTIFEKLTLEQDLQNVGLNVITMRDDNVAVPIGENGLARPSLNYGAVEFNYQDSTKTLSHESLHLVLEDMGYSQSCYVDKVHENAYRLARYYDNIMILKHFECQQDEIE